jgi:hypothetical protein
MLNGTQLMPVTTPNVMAAPTALPVNNANSMVMNQSFGGAPQTLNEQMLSDAMNGVAIAQAQVQQDMAQLGMMSTMGSPVPTGAPAGAMPGAVPGAMPGAVPGAMPGAVPGAMPGAVPGAMPGAVPGAMPGAVPGAVPQQAMPGTAQMIPQQQLAPNAFGNPLSGGLAGTQGMINSLMSSATNPTAGVGGVSQSVPGGGGMLNNILAQTPGFGQPLPPDPATAGVLGGTGAVGGTGDLATILVQLLSALTGQDMSAMLGLGGTGAPTSGELQQQQNLLRAGVGGKPTA